MTGTDERATDWSDPTHYEARARVVEPRMFTEADPMTTLIGLDWNDLDDGAATDAPRWGATTYVGRGHYRRRGAAAATAGTTQDTTDSAQVADGTGAGEDLEPSPVDAADAAGADAEAAERSNRGLLATSRSMAVASLTSRVTGFIRSVLIVAALGAAGVGDAYNSGNNFPNMVYELLLGGVLSSVLVPLLVRAQLEDDDEGVGYTQRLLSIATAALGVLTVLAVLAAPLIAGVFAKPETRSLTSLFATLLLPEIFFYGLGAMFMAVLNIRHSYAAGAWSPVLNNIIMIATVVVFWLLPGPSTFNPATITTAQILVIGIGTTLGIAAQALVLIPALRRTGFHWAWRFRAAPHEVGRMREVGQLAGWVIGYVVVSQIGVSVIQRVGNQLDGFTIFTQADLLFQMPYGILVVSLLTAIMPRLSRAAAREDTEAVVGDLSLGASLSALALVPVTAGLIVLGSPLGVTLFAHGRTSLHDAGLMGSALAWSAFGLFPFALVMLQMRVFYAMHDGRTPTVVNVAMVGVKVALVLITDHAYRSGTHHDRAIQWLNIATSVSYLVGAVIGHVLLRRRLGRLGFGRVWVTVAQVAAASAVGAAVAWVVVRAARHGIHGGHSSAAVGLVGGAVAGGAVLVVLAWRLPAVRAAVAQVRR